jgi:SAM-dependent methyltransferase
MIALARSNAAAKGLKPPQVAFTKALLTEPLPIESDSVDCIISNCVINLLPPEGKRFLFEEVNRILKPGGRVAMDDVGRLLIYTQISLICKALRSSLESLFQRT